MLIQQSNFVPTVYFIVHISTVVALVNERQSPIDTGG